MGEMVSANFEPHEPAIEPYELAKKRLEGNRIRRHRGQSLTNE